MKLNKDKQKRIALEKVQILLKEANTVFDENQALANAYVKKARKIAMRVNLRLPLALKRKFCKHCYSYFKPGKSYRVRTKNGKIIYSCFYCKKYTRVPFVQEKKRKHEKRD